MTFLLYLEALCLVFQLSYWKLYKSSVAILYLFIINTFVSPVIYYDLLDGNSYKFFSYNDLDKFVIIGCIYIAVIIVLNCFMKSTYKYSLRHYILHVGDTSKIVVNCLSIGIMATCFLYIFIFREYFPLLQQIFHHNIMATLDRPDVSGSIPLYFTISSIMCIFFPMYYFFTRERSSKKNDTMFNIVWYAIIAFVLLVGGNKGIMVYFAIFVWIYVWKMKVDWRIAITGILLFYAYEVTIYGAVMIMDGQLLDGLMSPFRRFFVTQGAMFINRIPLIDSGKEFSDGYISGYIYNIVYGVVGGSAPTYFLGDLMVQYGYVAGMLVGLTVTFITFFVGKLIDDGTGKKLYNYWSMFYVLYLMGNSAISSSFLIRVIIVIMLTTMLSLTDSNKNVDG